LILQREEQKFWSFLCYVVCSSISLKKHHSLATKKQNTYLVKHTKNQAPNTNKQNSENTNTKNLNTKTKEMAYPDKLGGQRRRNAEEWNHPTQPIFKMQTTKSSQSN